MKTRTTITVLSILAVAGTAGLLIAGPQNPPAGPVASTYKTLTEVEPRIAIDAINTPGDADATPSMFKITQPGSYYLTGNITGVAGKIGIEVAAPGVTLDLNGFSVTGVAGSLSGIVLRTGGTEVRRGTVRSWGGDGIEAEGAVNTNRVIDVRALGNVRVGIDAGNYSEVRNCTSSSNGSHGISLHAFGRLEACTTRYNGGDGVSVTNSGNIITNCNSNQNNGNGFDVSNSNTLIACSATNNTLNGIEASFSVVRDCTCDTNSQYGFSLGTASIATGSRATGNTFGGFFANGSCVLENNLATSNGDSVASRAGFVFSTSGNRGTNNHAVGNPIGFAVFGTLSVLTGNTAMSGTTGFQVASNANAMLTGNIAAGNTANYAISAGNDSGAIITNPGVGFATTNPAANYAN